ncbi:MAG TPA: CcmD family protein [Labilithrix sp.]|nr:CcmD family protein [Labilithrix sp.]
MISLDPTPSAPSSAAATPDNRATEFTAVDPNTEQFNGSTLLVEAYAAIWVILMGWLFLLWRKQAGLAVRLDDLERTIDRAAAAAEKKAKAGAS